MKKIYFIIPIVGTLIFFFFVSGVKSDIQAKADQRKKQQLEEQTDRAKQDLENRKKAWDIANAEANRKIEVAKVREAEEKRLAAIVQSAKDARDLVYRERERQHKRLSELVESRIVANELMAKVQDMIKLQQAQIDYLQKANKEVGQNKQSYEQALTKIQNAEDAMAKQAAAARDAARKG